MLSCFFRLTVIDQSLTQKTFRVRIIRIDPERFFIMGDRLGKLTEPMETDPEIVMRERAVRLQAHNVSVMLNRGVDSAGTQQNVAEICFRLRIVWLRFQSV